MTTIEAVQNGIDTIVRMMLGKGLIKPNAEFWVRANAEAHIYLSWDKRALPHYEVSNGVSKLFPAKDGDATLAIDAALDFINAMPSKEDRDRAEFTAKVADAVEYGRKIGVDIAPLMAAMEALSKNVIEHKKEGAL